MEEGETVSIISKKDLRKQKLTEYLAAKRGMKLPKPKTHISDDCQVNKLEASTLKVFKGKENKAPDDAFRYDGTKVPTAAAQSTKPAPRRAFDFTNKSNVKVNIRNAKHPFSPISAPARSEFKNQNPVLKKSDTIMSSKSNPNAGSLNIKQMSKGIQPSSSKLSRTNTVQSGPVKTDSLRMSLGPMVKTKTGLIPAVIQQRNTQLHLAHTSATAAKSSINSLDNKERRRTDLLISSGTAHSKTTCKTVCLAARPVSKVQNSSKLLSRHNSWQSQFSGHRMKLGLDPKCTPRVPPKSGEKVGLLNPIESKCEPTDKCAKQKTVWAGDGRKLSRVPSKTLLQPDSRNVTRAARRQCTAITASVSVRETKAPKETKFTDRHNSTKASLPQTATKGKVAPVMSQTVPLPIRTISRTGQATNIKTPKASVRVIPQSEGKKITAAQEERMRKLQEWREAKGISYKRPPMPVKPQVRRTIAVPQPFWTTMKQEDEAHSLIFAVERSLADCIKLLGEGCPPDQVKEVLSRLPAVSKKFSKYWICQVRLMEQEGNLDILPMFEEAVGVVLEPVDELRTVVFEILKKKEEIQASKENEEEEEEEEEEDQISTHESSPEIISNPMMTPKPTRALICGEKGHSSVVKYKITATPGGPPSQQRKPARVNGQEIRFVTPVRRSVRIERASLCYPASLQDHDLCVTSYNDLISKDDEGKSEVQEVETSPCVNDTAMYIYRENEALKDKVCVQLVCD